MPRNGQGRHAGLHPAFDLTHTSYFLDFVLVPGEILLLALMTPPSAVSAGWVAIGFIGWTLAEYWIHRLVFHGRTPFKAMHQMHHAMPKDMIGVASWATFAGFAATAVVIGPAFAIGFMLGYLAYCAIHVRMHHGDPAQFGRYVGFMFEHHAGHHRGGRGNFGVSSPVWDLVFRSNRLRGSGDQLLPRGVKLEMK